MVIVGYTQLHVSKPKNGKYRRIDRDATTLGALRAHRARQAEDRLAAGPAYSDEGWVFAREDGTQFHPHRASKLWEKLVKASGLPRMTLHDARHTHAAHLILKGVHVKVIQERLGHHSAAFTLDRYGHLFRSMQQDAAKAALDVLR